MAPNPCRIPARHALGAVRTWCAASATLLCGLGALPSAMAAPNELVYIAATNHSAPLSTFAGDRLVGGIVKDLGDALAQRLGLQARYVAQPSRRAPQALRDGMGDLLCYTRLQWIGTDFAFTLPVIANAEVVAARADAPKLTRLSDLSQQPVGTVLGYLHPELDEALGPAFRRENAPDMAANLRKLVAGRMAYALTDRLVLRDLQRRNPALGLREELVINTYTAPCALSPHTKLPLTAVNQAIKELLAEGEVQRILDRYAPTKVR